MHISIYLEVSEVYGAKVIWLRFLGGAIATVAGVVYYNFIYLWSADKGSRSHAIMHYVGDPAYLYAAFDMPEAARRRPQ